MLTRLILGFLLAGIPILSTAQVTTWMTQGTSTGYDQSYDVEVDEAGNTYLYGQSEGNGKTLTFGSFSQLISASQAAFVVKIDPGGTVKWLNVFPTNWIFPWDIAYGSGNIYITGQYVTSIQLNQITLNATGNGAFIARMDTSGLITWANDLGGAYQGKALAVDQAGAAIVAGHHRNNLQPGPGCSQLPGTAGFQNWSTFVVKYQSNPQQGCDWAINFPPSLISTGSSSYFNRPADIAIDDSGFVYVVGEFVGNMALGNGTTLSNPNDSSDTYVIRVSPFGQTDWGVASMGTGHTISTAIAVAPNAIVTVAGSSSSGGSFGSVTLDPSKNFLAQFQATSGTAITKKTFPSGFHNILDMDADSQSNLYITGEYYQPLFDLGNGVTGNLPNNSQGGFLGKLSSSMAGEWVKVWGNCCSANGNGLSLNNTETRLLLGGYYFGNITLDGIQLTSTGQNEAFLANISLVQPSDSIWPGDANDDLIANNMDVLHLGLGFGSTGPMRPNASLMWQAQSADLWGSAANGIDLVHADTDGNGLINADDTLAISLNYGLTHNKNSGTSGTGPELSVRFLQDSLLAGDTATVLVELGTGMNPAFNIYGLAFSLTMDTTLVDLPSASFDYSQSWLGTLGTDMIKLNKILEADGQIDLGICRTVQSSNSGAGEICRFTIIMVDDLTAKDLITEIFTIDLANVLIIDELGDDLGATVSSDTMVVYQDDATSVRPELEKWASVFPNPAADRIRVEVRNIRPIAWQLMNIHGQQVDDGTFSSSAQTIPVHHLPAGNYFLRLETDQGVTMKRFFINR